MAVLAICVILGSALGLFVHTAWNVARRQKVARPPRQLTEQGDVVPDDHDRT